MAPELENSPASYASDVWSFGVLLYDGFYGIGEFGFQKRDNIKFPDIKDDDGKIVSSLN